jgi:hypothetical protein
MHGMNNVKNYISFSPASVSSSYGLIDGCSSPIDIFFKCGEVKIFLRVSKMSYFYDLDKTQDTWRTEPHKTEKNGGPMLVI